MPKKTTAKTKSTQSKSSRPTRKTTRSSTTPAKKSWTHHYSTQRESFFVTHPYSRVLLGVFIVAFAFFVALLFKDKMFLLQAAENSYLYYH